MFGKETLLMDDFGNESTGSKWNIYTGDTGTINVSGGCVYLNITDQSKVGEYSHETLQSSGGFESVGIEMRLRCSDDNKISSDIGGGMRVWGFRDEGVMPQVNGMQFVCFSPESNPEWSGLSALNVNDGNTSRELIEGVDIAEWHIYTILLEPGNATFIIDGSPVATFDQVTEQRLHPYASLANLKFGGGEFGNMQNWGYDDISVDEYIEIDYVHVFGIPDASVSSIIGLLLLVFHRQIGSKSSSPSL
jgi:hypothetical protein